MRRYAGEAEVGAGSRYNARHLNVKWVACKLPVEVRIDRARNGATSQFIRVSHFEVHIELFELFKIQRFEVCVWRAFKFLDSEC